MRFALAAIDGAFVACRAGRGVTLERLVRRLAPALAASRRALLGAAGDNGVRPGVFYRNTSGPKDLTWGMAASPRRGRVKMSSMVRSSE